MGYSLGIYCELKVYNSKKLNKDITKFQPYYGGYASISFKAGYKFFGNYRMYTHDSWFYAICKYLDSDFFKYFSILDYVQDLDELGELANQLNWQNLKQVKRDIIYFAEETSKIDVEILFNETSEGCDHRIKEYFKNYFSRRDGYSLQDDLSTCIKFINAFEKNGAKQILFVYS